MSFYLLNIWSQRHVNFVIENSENQSWKNQVDNKIDTIDVNLKRNNENYLFYVRVFPELLATQQDLINPSKCKCPDPNNPSPH